MCARWLMERNHVKKNHGGSLEILDGVLGALYLNSPIPRDVRWDVLYIFFLFYKPQTPSFPLIVVPPPPPPPYLREIASSKREKLALCYSWRMKSSFLSARRCWGFLWGALLVPPRGRRRRDPKSQRAARRSLVSSDSLSSSRRVSDASGEHSSTSFGPLSRALP